MPGGMRRLLGVAVPVLAAAIAGAAAPDATAVVGGSPIEIQAAPWSVFVQDRRTSGRYVCTGTIVDASHVLTAAHCVFDDAGAVAEPSSLSVEAGISNFSAPLPTDAEQSRSVSSFRIHPGYAWSRGSSTDDIAVLALSQPLDLSGPAAQAVPLPEPGSPFPAGAAVGLAGFGRQSPAAVASGSLAWMTGTVDPQGACGSPGTISDDAVVLCASSPAGAVCNGDSGAGLVTTGSHVLIGVVSSGPTGCGAGGHAQFTYLGAPETLRFVQGDDRPPAAPRNTPATVVRLSWDPPLVVGNTLSCSSGNWTGAPRLRYAFVDFADGETLQSGKRTTYRLTAGDAGRRIVCRVTASNDGGAAVDGTVPTFPVKPAPKVTIERIEPVSAVRGGRVTLRVTLRVRRGLFGRVGACATPPPSVGRRICASVQNPNGDAGRFPFALGLRVRPTAPVGRARVTVRARAGVARATAAAVVRVSRP